MYKKRSLISSCAKIAPFVIFAALIAACSRDGRAADIKQCVAEAQQETAHGRLSYLLSATDNAEVRHDKIGGAVADCMGKSGYGHSNREMADERCVDDVDFNPYCYGR